MDSRGPSERRVIAGCDDMMPGGGVCALSHIYIHIYIYINTCIIAHLKVSVMSLTHIYVHTHMHLYMPRLESVLHVSCNTLFAPTCCRSRWQALQVDFS